jgi:NADH:ubiquinone oxidoreductase subunit 5 (subunit L)/multisubunit Na+/H+ antiporter MnhA subunit/multisubunit Na+/H+ antiporter MnhB subunit
MSIAIISVIPAFLALVISAVRTSLPKLPQTWGITVFISALFVWLLTFIPTVSQTGPIVLSIPWVAEIGLSLSLYVDGLSLLFSLMIVGIGALVVIYAGYYFDDAAELDRFYIRLLAFMSAMLLVVLAGNILTLFIGWELTSVISFLLISFNRDSEEARSGALQALIITGAGGLALLVGLVLLGTAAGTMELSQILTDTTLRESPWYTAFTVLILAGCFTKSAQWPFHFWLPGAMSAPTPASAYLHSATMVKAGIYLLFRLYPVLGDTPLWHTALLTIGLITALIGAAFALRQRDLKAGLAYSTISQLGILVALISLPEGEGLKAALVGIVAHGLYKAALFLMVGAVDHATGTRNLDELGGLARIIPGWAVVAVLAGLSMAGLPPLLGFVAKETLLEAMLGSSISLIIVLITAALTVAMALIIIWDVFAGETHHDHPHHLPNGLVLAPAVLAGGSILGGIGLQFLISPLAALTLGDNHLHLELFSGFNTPFLLSVVAIAGGAGIFVTRSTWRKWSLWTFPTGTIIYQKGISGAEWVASLLLRTQGGKLRYYLIAILCSVIVLQATAGLSHIIGYELEWVFNPSTDILRSLLLILALGMILSSILFRSHLVAALSLGVAGYGVGGLFLIEPAPDVALVQFMVETLGAVLLIVMLSRIKADEREKAMASLWTQSRAGLIRDIIISTLIGVGVGLFALAALTSRPKPQTIATWHLEHTEALVGFPDVVGAIVTDFRGMDTIIEITVFSVSALGVLTLLSKPAASAHWPKRVKKAITALRWNISQHSLEPDKTVSVSHVDIDDHHHTEDLFVSKFSTPLSRIIAQIVLPFAFIVALAQLLYGGDGPGDGFTAGVISGLGVALWHIVFGYHEARQKLRWLPARALIGSGLGLVILNAIMPMLFGQPFLAHVSFDIPLPAQLHLSSTLIYETGIFLTILGSVTTVMEAIAYPKEVEPL